MNHDMARSKLAPPTTGQRSIQIPTVLKLAIIFAAGILLSVVVANSSALAAPQSYTCTYYVVRRGDTLSGIGLRYGVTVRAVMNANGLRGTRIYSGQRLCIPRNPPAAYVPRQEPRDYANWSPYIPCGGGTGVQVVSVNGVPVSQGYAYAAVNCMTPLVVYNPPPVVYNPPAVVYSPPTGGAFPCTKGYFNASNLCIQQPYPVKIGSTAYAVWNISDFTYGEFDMGDGRGFVGPITKEQRVAIPNVTGPRLIQLRWQDHAGNWQYDSMMLQVVP